MFAGGKSYHQGQRLKEWIRERDNYTCQLCGKEGYIVDHILPWKVSHDSTISNLRVLCHSCNLKTRRVNKRANPYTTPGQWEAYIKAELAKC